MFQLLTLSALLFSAQAAEPAPVADLTSISTTSAADALDQARARAMWVCSGPAIVVAQVQNRLEDGNHTAHIWFTCATR